MSDPWNSAEFSMDADKSGVKRQGLRRWRLRKTYWFKFTFTLKKSISFKIHYRSLQACTVSEYLHNTSQGNTEDYDSDIDYKDDRGNLSKMTNLII